MSGLAGISNVRDVGNLPVEIADDVISTQLQAAQRRLRSWIGNYDRVTGDDRYAVIEAECCICMALLIPVLNTFYTAGSARMQREIGELEFVFNSPAQAQAISDGWINRARDAVNSMMISKNSGEMKWAVI